MIPRSSLWDRLFRGEGQGWLKFAGVVGIMMLIGLKFGLRMLKERPEVGGAAAVGVLAGTVTFCAILGSLLGSMFVARDAVMSRLNRGKHVNVLLRIFLGPGIISLLTVSFVACIIIIPMIVALVESKPLTGTRNIAARNAPTSVNATLPPPPPSPQTLSPQAQLQNAPATPPHPAFESRNDSPAPAVMTGEAQRTNTLSDVPPSSPPQKSRIDNLISPLHISPDVSPKEAYMQFVERYGADRVARVIVRMKSEQLNADLQLKVELMRGAASGQPSSIYVSTKGLTMAGIVAPVDSIENLAHELSVAKVTQVQKDSRIVTANWADEPEGRESKPRSPRAFNEPERAISRPQDASDELSRLVAQLDQADLRQRDQLCAAIAALKTPQAAEALATRLGGSAYFAASDALQTMGEIAFDPLLAQAQSRDFTTSSRAFNVLSDMGTKELLPKLQRLARNRDRRIAMQAQMTIDRIQRQP